MKKYVFVMATMVLAPAASFGQVEGGAQSKLNLAERVKCQTLITTASNPNIQDGQRVNMSKSKSILGNNFHARFLSKSGIGYDITIQTQHIAGEVDEASVETAVRKTVVSKDSKESKTDRTVLAASLHEGLRETIDLRFSADDEDGDVEVRVLCDE